MLKLGTCVTFMYWSIDRFGTGNLKELHDSRGLKLTSREPFKLINFIEIKCIESEYLNSKFEVQFEYYY